jgi:septal ring-binding cell division protein DamX
MARRPLRRLSPQKSEAHEALKRYVLAKESAELANEELRDAQSAVLEAMSNAGIKSTAVDTPGLKIQGTIVEAEHTEINESGLRKELGGLLWKAITSPQLDKRKLESCISLGKIPVHVVAKHTHVVPHAPYVRVTLKNTTKPS